MRFTLPKNRTAPLIIFAVISIIVSLMLGLYHMSRMVDYSYRTKLENYDSLAVNTAALFKQEIDNKYQSMQVMADLVAKAGDLSRENIISLLPLLAKDKEFTDAAVVGIDGKGYNRKGQAVDASGESYCIEALSGKKKSSNVISYTAGNIPVIYFAVPILDNGQVKGALITQVNAQMDNQTLFKKEISEGCLIYLLNENNELISFAQDTDITGFNYDKVISEGYFYENNELAPKKVNLGEYFFNDRTDRPRIL